MQQMEEADDTVKESVHSSFCIGKKAVTKKDEQKENGFTHLQVITTHLFQPQIYCMTCSTLLGLYIASAKGFPTCPAGDYSMIQRSVARFVAIHCRKNVFDKFQVDVYQNKTESSLQLADLKATTQQKDLCENRPETVRINLLDFFFAVILHPPTKLK